MKIDNIKEAEAALMAYVPRAKQMSPKDTMLDRIQPLMERLGNPQNRIKVIHVAGTSGKTSTSYYMAALLRASGKRVGLTVSPHVDSITERVQIDGSPITEAVFCQELSVFLDVVESADNKPSYFELLYAFAIWVLWRQKVDYAVVETGVGGLHDATNVTTRADKVCVITDIGFDHMRLLGETLPEIAAQKVGIVHDHNHVFMYRQDDAIMEIIKNWTGGHDAPLHIIGDKPDRPITNTMPDYQQRNWNLAHAVYEYLRKRDNLKHLTSQVLAQTQQVRVPGRMDIIKINDKTVVMDGAHNAQKMTAFIDSFQRLYPGVKPAVLLSLKTGKEYEKVVPLITNLASRVIITTFETSQDLPVKSTDPDVLVKAFQSAGMREVERIDDSRTAFKTLMALPSEVCVITGSFYLLGQIRNNENLV